MKIALGVVAAALVACGGGGKKEVETAGQPATAVGQPEAGDVDETSGPITRPDDPWADWQTTFTNVGTDKWISKTHGKRFVEIWVNDVALEAYKSEAAELPVGSVVVKPSWENDSGTPGAEGPLFVMVKKEAGYSGDDWDGDWYYAFVWANPEGEWKKKLGGATRWESKSGKVEYCFDCHDSYDRQLGMPPEEKRSW